MLYPLDFGVGLDPWSKILANQPWNYFRCITLQPIWSRYFNDRETFCQFCGIFFINGPESRL